MSSWPATIPMAVLEFWPLHGFKAAGSFPAWPIDGKGWTLPALTLLTPTLPSRLLPTSPNHPSHALIQWTRCQFHRCCRNYWWGQNITGSKKAQHQVLGAICHISHFLLFILHPAHPNAADAPPALVILSHCWQWLAKVKLKASTSQ